MCTPKECDRCLRECKSIAAPTRRRKTTFSSSISGHVALSQPNRWWSMCIVKRLHFFSLARSAFLVHVVLVLPFVAAQEMSNIVTVQCVVHGSREVEDGSIHLSGVYSYKLSFGSNQLNKFIASRMSHKWLCGTRSDGAVRVSRAHILLRKTNGAMSCMCVLSFCNLATIFHACPMTASLIRTHNKIVSMSDV